MRLSARLRKAPNCFPPRILTSLLSGDYGARRDHICRVPVRRLRNSLGGFAGRILRRARILGFLQPRLREVVPWFAGKSEPLFIRERRVVYHPAAEGPDYARAAYRISAAVPRRRDIRELALPGIRVFPGVHLRARGLDEQQAGG